MPDAERGQFLPGLVVTHPQQAYVIVGKVRTQAVHIGQIILGESQVFTGGRRRISLGRLFRAVKATLAERLYGLLPPRRRRANPALSNAQSEAGRSNPANITS